MFSHRILNHSLSWEVDDYLKKKKFQKISILWEVMSSQSGQCQFDCMKRQRGSKKIDLNWLLINWKIIIIIAIEMFILIRRKSNNMHRNESLNLSFLILCVDKLNSATSERINYLFLQLWILSFSVKRIFFRCAPIAMQCPRDQWSRPDRLWTTDLISRFWFNDAHLFSVEEERNDFLERYSNEILPIHRSWYAIFDTCYLRYVTRAFIRFTLF